MPAASTIRNRRASDSSAIHMAQKDVKLVIANKLYEKGLEALRKVVDTTLTMKFTDAQRYFEAAGDTFATIGRCACSASVNVLLQVLRAFLIMDHLFPTRICPNAGRRAGEAYRQCADCEKRMGHALVAATYFVDAARAYRRANPLEAVEMYVVAIAELAKLGRFLEAASLQRDVAEIHEDDGANYEASMAYVNVAEYYIGEALFPQAARFLNRAAEHMVEEERFHEAAELFERTLRLCMDDNLMRFNTPGLALNIVLCFLALRDDERALDFVEDYGQEDYMFIVSREKRFCVNIILCAQDRRADDFMDHLWNFDYVVEFEPFQLKLLEDVYEGICQQVDEEEEQEESSGPDSWQSSEEESEEEDEDESSEDCDVSEDESSAAI